MLLLGSLAKATKQPGILLETQLAQNLGERDCKSLPNHPSYIAILGETLGILGVHIVHVQSQITSVMRNSI